ncbi:unnamed protein product [Rotaria sordida]|uniref:Uncharacterized protein n=1 Tax=Rotaria sordida TaxID=392033 RepID=A0A819ICB4_9BILA|nr:unnamed protein product [Rotaria sordida]
MFELGLCTDITCNDEMKQLFECYCCLRLVCLTHLITHLEIKKQNKQQLDDIQKLLTIKHEQNLIEQAERFLDMPSSSFDELQNLFENINQIIGSNQSEEIMIKVEPLLSETKYCSCICTCNKQNMNSNEKTNINDINCDFIDTIALDAATTSTENPHVNEKQERRQISYRKLIDKCPLTFDGAYGLTAANHSIRSSDV